MLSLVLVMPADLNDKNRHDIIVDIINNAVVRGETTRPSNIIRANQRLWMSCASPWVFFKFRQQIIQPLNNTGFDFFHFLMDFCTLEVYSMLYFIARPTTFVQHLRCRTSESFLHYTPLLLLP